jgi:hypothetical protein
LSERERERERERKREKGKETFLNFYQQNKKLLGKTLFLHIGHNTSNSSDNNLFDICGKSGNDYSDDKSWILESRSFVRIGQG